MTSNMNNMNPTPSFHSTSILRFNRSATIPGAPEWPTRPLPELNLAKSSIAIPVPHSPGWTPPSAIFVPRKSRARAFSMSADDLQFPLDLDPEVHGVEHCEHWENRIEALRRESDEAINNALIPEKLGSVSLPSSVFLPKQRMLNHAVCSTAPP